MDLLSYVKVGWIVGNELVVKVPNKDTRTIPTSFRMMIIVNLEVIHYIDKVLSFILSRFFRAIAPVTFPTKCSEDNLP